MIAHSRSNNVGPASLQHNVLDKVISVSQFDAVSNYKLPDSIVYFLRLFQGVINQKAEFGNGLNTLCITL